MQSIERVVVFSSDPNFAVRQGLRQILDQFPDLRILLLLHRPKRSKSRLFRNQLRNLRRHGWRWIPYQFTEIIERQTTMRAAPFDSDITSGSPGRRFDLSSLVGTGRLRVETLQSLNSDAARALVQNFRADLGVSLGAPVLHTNVFSVPRLGTINLHKGKLPDYRGMPPAFWELVDGRDHVGCTVHIVETKLDTGAILAESELPIPHYATAAGMRVGLDQLGNRLLVETIALLSDDRATPRPQSGKGKTNTRPKLGLESRVRRRANAKEGMVGPRQLAKDTVFSGYSLIRNATVGLKPSSSSTLVRVLLYHRINDALRDSVTCGIERFDRHLAFLKRHYLVVPLRALVRNEIDYRSSRPLVCITFDDGYLDNYEFAAPLLLKHKLPATFFVTTDMISRQIAFPHDVSKLGHGLPNMTWNHIREMSQEGLDFGSHTATHANLGGLTREEAWRELTMSREALAQELGQEEFLFAYPFGGRGDITPMHRQLVAEAGYACCCSAYGGSNRLPLDLYEIRRFGVNYAFSLATLKSCLAGWTEH